MLCEHCHKREATMHYTQVINGQHTEAHLCAECASKDPLLGRHAMGRMGPLMGSFFENALFRDWWREPEGRFGEISCPSCGTTLDMISHENMMGCPECYETFREKLKPFFRKTQEGTKHVGKVPGSPEEHTDESVSPEVKALREKLASLIEEENYEEAARIRDEIKQLTSKGEDNDNH